MDLLLNEKGRKHGGGLKPSFAGDAEGGRHVRCWSLVEIRLSGGLGGIIHDQEPTEYS